MGIIENIEVLISCMRQIDTSIVERSRITTDALLINQCDKEIVYEPQMVSDKQIIRRIDTKERGLSRSRNKALDNANGTIAVLCDDDEKFEERYSSIIEEAYKNHPDADIIAFRMSNQPCKLGKKEQRINKWSALHISSWQITYRPDSIKRAGVRFDIHMGAGTRHGAGEEVKFLRDALSAGLKAYYVPRDIASVAQQISTWFSGYDKDFFYKRGVMTRHLLGLPVAVLYALYYVLTKRPMYIKSISSWMAFIATVQGIIADDISKEARSKTRLEN